MKIADQAKNRRVQRVFEFGVILLEDSVSQDSSLLCMSLAYLEVGRAAASSNSRMSDVGAYQNAVAYQLLHALELFYKYMISQAGMRFCYSHDIDELEKQYISIYSKQSHAIEHPFNFSSYAKATANSEEGIFVASHLSQFPPEYLSQHLRYPASVRTGGYSFCLDESYFEGVRIRMMEIASLNGR